MAKKSSSIHVIANSTGSWSVRKGGASKASKVFETRNAAVTYARDGAKKAGGDLFVHSKDGSIRERSTYGADTKVPKK